jgi:hypothetical protein
LFIARVTMHVNDTGPWFLVMLDGGMTTLQLFVLEVRNLKVSCDASVAAKFDLTGCTCVVGVFRPRRSNDEVEEHRGVHIYDLSVI